MSEGLTYLLDLAGNSLRQANQRIAELTEQNRALAAELAAKNAQPPDAESK